LHRFENGETHILDIQFIHLRFLRSKGRGVIPLFGICQLERLADSLSIDGIFGSSTNLPENVIQNSVDDGDFGSVFYNELGYLRRIYKSEERYLKEVDKIIKAEEPASMSDEQKNEMINDELRDSGWDEYFSMDRE